MIDFYADHILPEIHVVCEPLGIVQEVGYPTAINSHSLLSHIFDGMTADAQGQLTLLRYTTIHRIAVQWQVFEAAERLVIQHSNALFQRLLKRSKSPLTLPQSDMITGEQFQLQALTTGFITVATKTYRVADVRTIIGVKLSSAYWSSL